MGYLFSFKLPNIETILDTEIVHIQWIETENGILFDYIQLTQYENIVRHTNCPFSVERN